MHGYIYKITIEDQKSKLYNCYYIGRHVSNKIDDEYYGSGVIIKDYINKKGKSLLKKEILYICESEKELNEKEFQSIGDLYLTDSFFKNGKCLNMKAGGDCGLTSEESKRKMSQATSGKNNGFYGKHHSDELKKRYSKIFANKNNPMFGKTHSEAAREKLRNSHLGTKHKPETIEKYKQMRKGLHWFTNGKTDKFCKECPGKEWKQGRLNLKNHKQE